MGGTDKEMKPLIISDFLILFLIPLVVAFRPLYSYWKFFVSGSPA